jgi:hypothetical protein
VTAITSLVDKQIYTRSMALKEVRQLGDVTNFGSNITDEDVTQAEEDEKEARENPPSPEELGLDNSNSGRLPEGETRTQPRANGAGHPGVRVTAP